MCINVGRVATVAELLKYLLRTAYLSYVRIRSTFRTVDCDLEAAGEMV